MKADFLAGVSAVNVSRGNLLIEECDISSYSRSGVLIQGKNSNLTIRNCKIHDSALPEAGYLVYDSGSGDHRNLRHLRRNKALAGVGIREGGELTVRACQIHDNGGYRLQDSEIGFGVQVADQGNGTIEGCNIFANKLGGALAFRRAAT